ncbi:MAG: DUF5710 domain-containing protein [Deltaproteobacteria bacterium]|jgi:antirestriction protein ArdC/phage/plasmid primase-like uncharacterized protein|nr:DUF5710 domain-containing protein [Deltaproteobacteria bacterium]
MVDKRLDTIAESILKKIQESDAPWQKPWAASASVMAPFNPVTKTQYSGINMISLFSAGYSDPRWFTFNNALSSGYKVPRGTKGSPGEFWKTTELVPKLDQNGNEIIGPDGKPEKEEVRLERPVHKRFFLFNAAQLTLADGEPLPPYEPLRDRGENRFFTPVETGENIINGFGVAIKHDQENRNYYIRTQDEVHLTPKSSFFSTDDYYSTVNHELAHATQHESRLNRPSSAGNMHSEAYAREELIAEISAWLVAVKTGMAFKPQNHAAYLKDWLSYLQNNPEEIRRAIKVADDVSDYMVERGNKYAMEAGRNQTAEVRSESELLRPGPDGQLTPIEAILNDLAANGTGDTREVSANVLNIVTDIRQAAEKLRDQEIQDNQPYRQPVSLDSHFPDSITLTSVTDYDSPGTPSDTLDRQERLDFKLLHDGKLVQGSITFGIHEDGKITYDSVAVPSLLWTKFLQIRQQLRGRDAPSDEFVYPDLTAEREEIVSRWSLGQDKARELKEKNSQSGPPVLTLISNSFANPNTSLISGDGRLAVDRIMADYTSKLSDGPNVRIINNPIFLNSDSEAVSPWDDINVTYLGLNVNPIDSSVISQDYRISFKIPEEYRPEIEGLENDGQYSEGHIFICDYNDSRISFDRIVLPKQTWHKFHELNGSVKAAQENSPVSGNSENPGRPVSEFAMEAPGVESPAVISQLPLPLPDGFSLVSRAYSPDELELSAEIARDRSSLIDTNFFLPLPDDCRQLFERMMIDNAYGRAEELGAANVSSEPYPVPTFSRNDLSVISVIGALMGSASDLKWLDKHVYLTFKPTGLSPADDSAVQIEFGVAKTGDVFVGNMEANDRVKEQYGYTAADTVPFLRNLFSELRDNYVEHNQISPAEPNPVGQPTAGLPGQPAAVPGNSLAVPDNFSLVSGTYSPEELRQAEEIIRSAFDSPTPSFPLIGQTRQIFDRIMNDAAIGRSEHPDTDFQQPTHFFSPESFSRDNLTVCEIPSDVLTPEESLWLDKRIRMILKPYGDETVDLTFDVAKTGDVFFSEASLKTAAQLKYNFCDSNNRPSDVRKFTERLFDEVRLNYLDHNKIDPGEYRRHGAKYWPWYQAGQLPEFSSEDSKALASLREMALNRKLEILDSGAVPDQTVRLSPDLGRDVTLTALPPAYVALNQKFRVKDIVEFNEISLSSSASDRPEYFEKQTLIFGLDKDGKFRAVPKYPFISSELNQTPFSGILNKLAENFAESAGSDLAGQLKKSPRTAEKVTYLDVPFEERAKAKVSGARWDPAKKAWFVAKGLDLNGFGQWPEKNFQKVPKPIPQTPLGTSLDVPFEDKDKVKELGAEWDSDNKVWYVPEGLETDKFEQWAVKPPAPALKTVPAVVPGTILKVPFEEKEAARELGAKWDPDSKVWYVPEGLETDKFERWAVKESARTAPAGAQPKEKLQKLIDEAVDKGSNVIQLCQHLKDNGVEVRPNVTSTGRMNGFSFAVDGTELRGSSLGKDYAWGGLQRRGVAYDREQDQDALKNFSPGRTASQPETEPAAEQKSQPGTTVLKVPFKEKDAAKELGAKWDSDNKVWHVPEGLDAAKFEQWFPENQKSEPINSAPQVLSPAEELKNMIYAAGLVLDGEPVMDGTIQRVSAADSKPHDKSGSYLAYSDGRPNGWIRNYKSGEKIKWVFTGQQMSSAEIEALRQTSEQKMAEKSLAAATAQKVAVSELTDKLQFPNIRAADSVEFEHGFKHQYLLKKRISATAGIMLEQTDKRINLIIPGYKLNKDRTLELQTAQTITPSGGKFFEKGCPKTGALHLVELFPDSVKEQYEAYETPESASKKTEKPKILVAEGYATAVSLHKATGLPVACAFDSGNLAPVSRSLKEAYPEASIIICADNDFKTEKNVGLAKAAEAAKEVGGIVFTPSFNQKELEDGLTDFNDFVCSRGVIQGSEQIQKDLARTASFEAVTSKSQAKTSGL